MTCGSEAGRGRSRGRGGGRDFKGGDESTVRSIGLLGLFLAGTDFADLADLAARARAAFLLAAFASSFFFFSIASIAAAWEAAAEDTASRFLRSMSEI